jgi:hypothetical protein
LLHRKTPYNLLTASVELGDLMAKRSILAGLALATVLGACSGRMPLAAYKAPGWYLERPRMLLVTGPEIFAGPFTYDQCEAERMKFDDVTAKRLLCIHEKSRPGFHGPYTGTIS